MSVNWIAAKIIPRQWEGTWKMCWDKNGGVRMDVVPANFSREEKHCGGFYYANIPEPPKES